MNEHSVAFNARTGHNHDGINSAPIELATGIIESRHLSPELLEYLDDYFGAANSPDVVGTSYSDVPDLVFEVDSVAPGESATGLVPWVSSAIVKYVKVETTDEEGLCDITFYHSESFINSNREFKASDCTNNFLYEGVWAHTDDTDSENVYYKIENTGSSTATYTVTLKSATMIAAGEITASGSISYGSAEEEVVVDEFGIAEITFSTEKQGIGFGYLYIFVVSSTGTRAIVNMPFPAPITGTLAPESGGGTIIIPYYFPGILAESFGPFSVYVDDFSEGDVVLGYLVYPT